MRTLRIISDEQWQAVHTRLAAAHASLATFAGSQRGTRRSRDIKSVYLLPGFARCACCGGSFGVTGGSRSSARAHTYGCLAYHKRGTTVCGNGLEMRLERIDDAVLRTLGGDVLRPPVVMAIVEGVLDALGPDAAAREVDRLQTELQGVAREAERLAEAIATGGQLAPLLEALRARQASIVARSARRAAQVHARGQNVSVRRGSPVRRARRWNGRLTN